MSLHLNFNSRNQWLCWRGGRSKKKHLPRKKNWKKKPEDFFQLIKHPKIKKCLILHLVSGLSRAGGAFGKIFTCGKWMSKGGRGRLIALFLTSPEKFPKKGEWGRENCINIREKKDIIYRTQKYYRKFMLNHSVSHVNFWWLKHGGRA